MGGQACILYGAAEFSRDVDLAVAPDERNLDRLRGALAALRAEPVYLPPLGSEVLQRGHACHFRAHSSEARGVRIDVMAVMHGCEDFETLWSRRRRLRLRGVGTIATLDLPDLVRAKKTQRDKDWPMIRRLLEVDFENRPSRPSRQRIVFWLKEVRTPETLVELCKRYRDLAQKLSKERPALRAALREDLSRIERALAEEELAYRAADRAYWKPRRAELFRWRQERRKKP